MARSNLPSPPSLSFLQPERNSSKKRDKERDIFPLYSPNFFFLLFIEQLRKNLFQGELVLIRSLENFEFLAPQEQRTIDKSIILNVVPLHSSNTSTSSRKIDRMNRTFDRIIPPPPNSTRISTNFPFCHRRQGAHIFPIHLQISRSSPFDHDATKLRLSNISSPPDSRLASFFLLAFRSVPRASRG